MRLRRGLVCLSTMFFMGTVLGQLNAEDSTVTDDVQPASHDAAMTATDATAPEAEAVAGLIWHTDYLEAYRTAKSEERMLLVNFVDDRAPATQARVEQAIASSANLKQKLEDMVLLRLAPDEPVELGDEAKPLLRHAAFGEMHGKPGIAIIDLEHTGESYYGHVVSAYPFTSSKYYRWQPNYLHSIVDLPPGTITQRTMVWAIKIHPERPASVEGIAAEELLRAAESHSHHQASIGNQGHHNWDRRFHQVRALVGASDASEVVAESWPNQTMIDSCIDCVDSWRQSSGHWGAIKRRHRMFGYDIKRGRNGIWYGTGIFAN